MTEAPEQPPLTVAFVLASYTVDAPAGMERATAALASGLRQLGHRAVILTAAEQPEPDPDVIRLHTLASSFPCDDDTLRRAIHEAGDRLHREIVATFDALGVDVAVYVDALWGLGRVAVQHRARSVLATHVIGHDEDLAVALASVEHVVAPSSTVLDQAREQGYDTDGWSVIPNGLLHDHPRPDEAARETLRRRAPIRVLGRLGPEKNIPALVNEARLLERPAEVVVADAGFETVPGAQGGEWSRCQHAAAHSPWLHLRSGGIRWADVPAWLAEAAVVIVPSLRESFGLVALEAMSVGTPVVCYDVDHLPSLVGTGPEAGGVTVPKSQGEHALWTAAGDLLGDPVRYRHLSRAAYYRSRDFRPITVAEWFVKAVR
ncbi:glycosyltransferase [Saccharomonospora sp. CUA-673]|uniref:glycosyltransferase family 4 protein n=1 Tax=Saccharomonospora sp. CUA-673 TaxID=1904969 RepID=UPI00095FEDF2|nr:glycosyltransferase family 4 protein [Saccharomonospora sp. CUA-673]OLT41699.1 glycosyltransferase [Saccharomonospora sp. CUA-673]